MAVQKTQVSGIQQLQSAVLLNAFCNGLTVEVGVDGNFVFTLLSFMACNHIRKHS